MSADRGSAPSMLLDQKELREALNVRSLEVLLDGAPIGTLAATSDGLAAFEYADDWIANGFALNPLSLPLEKRVFVAKRHPFEGLFGVFDDSLPDGWGRLLVDRFLREQGIDPFEVAFLGRLAIVGESGMGALGYRPTITQPPRASDRTLDELADECAAMLKTDFSDDLDTLFALGGSSGGARPKILTVIDGEEWIVKFPSSMDTRDIGKHEFECAQAAAEAGIEMPEVRLLPSDRCSGYFAIKRFDRVPREGGGSSRKVHMASAGALLEASHRVPSLDYDLLMKLALRLTGAMAEVEALYRLMAFNVAIGNRDDHAKNFTFVRPTDVQGVWHLSPGYDLTSNAGINGEHSTTVNGKGRGITREDLLAVAKRAGISTSRARIILDEVGDAVRGHGL